ncbi:plasmodesmata-located protein 7-like [Rhodamnia argentea]|uniref:Plasmodesmata-located protein 7-like n=1 Tax=Rhodamnia argentea TaxID=178133 RepID=A0A8B8P2T1_9MYRT|nr:plasmodesmata-located protein 7-like [Rhodamnia argentea]
MATFKIAVASIVTGLFIIRNSVRADFDPSKYDPICNGETFEYGSLFHQHLTQVFQDLAAATDARYDYYTSAGTTETVYGHGACVAGYSERQCYSCMVGAINPLMDDCPFNAGAQLRYGEDCRISIEKYTVADFYAIRRELMLERLKANIGDYYDLYANSSDDSVVPNPDHCFGHGSCNPRIAKEECSECINFTISRMSKDCILSVGVQHQMKDCRVRYEKHPFHE